MSEKRRVLLIGPLPIEGDVIGGTKVSFANLVREMSDSAHYRVQVHDTSRVREGRGPLRRRFDDLLGLLTLAARLLVLLPRPRAVVFNTSSGGALWAGPVVWALCRLWRVPLALRVFGGDFDLFLERAPRRLRELARRSVLRAELVLLQTQALCRHFEHETNTRWWPTTRELRPDPRPPRERARRFLFLGQLRPEKGAIEAAKAAQHLPHDARLTIRGPAMPGFDVRQLDQGPRAAFGGALASGEVKDLLARHDVLVFPSYHEGEGIPGVLIEAFQMGLPVIATRWRSLEEVVLDGRNGLVVAPRDEVALAVAMRRLAEDDELYRRLRAAALESGEHFRSGPWIEQLCQWLEHLSDAPTVTHGAERSPLEEAA